MTKIQFMLDQVTGYLADSRITDVSHIKSDIALVLGENRLWIDTPWRLERNGRIVIGNDNLVELLYHEDYKFDYESSVAFIKDCLKGAVIVEVNYSDFNELILQLSNGYRFRSFQTFGDDEDEVENFQLTISKKRYLVYPKKIEIEDLGGFYKGH